ncbi:unnamed protein product [Caenorhabditis sp. 36 PRJEB53466]|nr:unnamed protein product [Caenorhabditis sp. 36 PRJEB53466]
MFRDFLVETKVRREAIASMLKSTKLADGLLGTTLEWTDVEEIANDGFDGELRIGDKKTIRPLAEGVGLQSLLGMAEVEWDVKGDGQKPYPNKFALKIGSPVALLQALEAQAAKLPPEVAANVSDEFIRFLPPCHNSEIYFYEYVSTLHPRLPELPEFYFGREIELLKDGFYSKGCIAIELVEGVKTLSPLENFSDAQMIQVLDALAKLQTHFIDMPEDQRRKAPHQGLAGLYSTFKDWFLQLNNGLMLQFPDPDLQKLAEEFAVSLPEIITADELDQVPAKLGMKKVLVHGDLWSANIMWEGDRLAKLIDFQMIHFGLAATDLARVFNTCLSPEDRQQNKEKYLESYYKSLKKHCAEKDRPVPFEFEQLRSTYELAYPRVSAYLLPALTAILEKVLQMPDVPEKSMILSMFISKVKGIYSDIIRTYQNRSKF